MPASKVLTYPDREISRTKPIKLSVVIPAFNAEAYISDCLASVINQIGAPDFEVIVVDDGSTDRTAKIVTKDFKTVRLLNKTNGGPGSARNFGVSYARSDVIVFIDADDLMLPGRLALQGRFMLENPSIGLSFGNQLQQNSPRYDANFDRALCETTEFSIVRNAYARLICEGNYIANTACAVRRSVFREIGGQPENIFVAEDYAMNCAIARKYPIAASRRFLTWYRQSHGSNLMSSSHAYEGPIKVLCQELSAHTKRLTLTERRVASRRGRKLANMLLRWLWVESGHAAVSSRLQELGPLRSPLLELKWRILSRVPRAFGRRFRTLKRLVRRISLSPRDLSER